MTTVQRWTGAEIKALRSAMRLTVRAFAEHLGVDSRTVNKWESRGSGITPRPETQGILDSALRLAGRKVQSRFAQAVDRGRQVSRVATPVRDRFSPGDVEQLRRALHDLFAGGQVTAASLDDWEQTVARQGTATKDRPATILVRDLAADVAELGRVMAGCHSLSAQRRLTRVAANLSGLMCLTQVKLDDRQAFRRWARTARIAANEADDASTYSWVLPSVGQTKRAPPCGEPRLWCPGWAWKGRNHRRSPYNEAQLRFHESSAMTHLGDIRAAWLAQDKALALVASADFMDRTFTRPDRATCIAATGDPAGASSYARDTLLALTEAQRVGIITGRARQFIEAMPKRVRAQPAVHELHDLLMLPQGQEG